MIAVMLFMLVGGIAFSQAVSDPRAVTLQWLRLGGITSVTLLGLVGAVYVRDATGTAATESIGAAGNPFGVWGATLASAIAQLVAVQLDKRKAQRLLAGMVFVLAVVSAVFAAPELFVGSETAQQHGDFYVTYSRIALTPTVFVAASLVGGYVMTMLLGHAYLTAGSEMTQAPFRRLVIWLGVLLIARAVLSCGFGLAMLFWKEQGISELGIWKTSILAARLFVGLVVPMIFTWMIYDCVKRRANQSATGILYVASLLVIIGEWAAVSLWESTGWIF